MCPIRLVFGERGNENDLVHEYPVSDSPDVQRFIRWGLFRGPTVGIPAWANLSSLVKLLVMRHSKFSSLIEHSCPLGSVETVVFPIASADYACK